MIDDGKFKVKFFYNRFLAFFKKKNYTSSSDNDDEWFEEEEKRKKDNEVIHNYDEFASEKKANQKPKKKIKISDYLNERDYLINDTTVLFKDLKHWNFFDFNDNLIELHFSKKYDITLNQKNLDAKPFLLSFLFSKLSYISTLSLTTLVILPFFFCFLFFSFILYLVFFNELIVYFYSNSFSSALYGPFYLKGNLNKGDFPYFTFDFESDVENFLDNYNFYLHLNYIREHLRNIFISELIKGPVSLEDPKERL